MRHGRWEDARRGGVVCTVRTRLAGRLLLATLLAGAAGAAAQTTETDATHARAVALFEQGLAAFQAGDFPAAREAFQASFELRANPTVLYNLASTQRALFEYPASIASFERYLELMGERAEAAERAEILEWIGAMSESVARVLIEAPAGAAISLDGTEVGRAPLPEPLLVDPGPHVLVATREGYAPARSEIRPDGGAELTVQLEPAPLAPAPAPNVVEGPTPAPSLVEGSMLRPVLEQPLGPPQPAARTPGDWGIVPVGLGLGMNLRAVDFRNRPFADNFYWTIGAGVQITDWFAAALDVVLPAVDFALWARFAFVRTDRFRLSATPGIVVSTGAVDDRGAGFALAAGLLAEFRLWSGLVLSLSPTVGLDVTRVVLVAPLSLGLAFYI
jgi:hypothetical protein